MELQHHHSIQINQVPVSRLSRPIPPPPPLPEKRRNRPAPPPPIPKKRGNRPDATYLSEDQREIYMRVCIPLYHAAVKDDWHAAEEIIREHPEAINRSITKREDTLLHIVASTEHTYFAQKLVNLMRVEDLELRNGDGETALFLALASTVKMVDILLKRNSGLLRLRNKDNSPPFLCAVTYGDKHMVSYIYSKTNLEDEMWNALDQKRILIPCLAFRLYDIALDIFKYYMHQGNLTNYAHVLRYLANNPDLFDGTMGHGARILVNACKYPDLFDGTMGHGARRLVNALLSGTRLLPTDNTKAVEIVRIMWGEILKQKHEHTLRQIAGEGLLFTAARLGNYKFIMELLSMYPDIAWDRDENKHTIFHIAVIHRQENVYNLLYEVGSKKLLSIPDNSGNNILHLAAKKPEQDRLNVVSGAALQMQREFLWFKEVETLVTSAERRKKNKLGKTPQEIFSEEHKELMEQGKRWMKETVAQCIVVAALVATITFAAAFTLPGGNNQENGYPTFMKQSAFIMFVVADTLSLYTSSASILVFLSILTQRYTENDFLVSLPARLLIGLETLHFSVATMILAFSANTILLYGNSMKWKSVLITALGLVPFAFSFWLQFGLLYDIFFSTFSTSRLLSRP